MAFYHRSGERKRITHDFRRQEEEVVGSLCRLGNRPISPKSLLEQEKRIRREIANSNERRRMQSINAGFQSLRSLLPHREGEKLSKAAVLQNTADYIYQLEQEKTHLLEQNCQLKRRVINSQNNQDSDGSCSDSPLPKRKKREPSDSIDEGIGSSSPARSESSIEDIKRELIELKLTLERERSLRAVLEEQVKNLESQLHVAENVQDTTNQSHLSYQTLPEEPEKLTVMNLMSDGEVSGTESHISNQEMDSPHEIPQLESSPQLSIPEVPEDLSGKNSSLLLPCESELSLSDVNTIPGLILSQTLLQHTSSPPYSVELEIAPQPVTYKLSTSRQNLETIVEAIRHVEGDHLFCDDPEPTETLINHWTEQQQQQQQETVNTETVKEQLCEEQTQQTVSLLTNPDFSFQHQIIRNAPITQSRPGVIVSNHS